MSAEQNFRDFKRILVALDASPASIAALDLAADLAERYQAELLGIFVEDINLLRSAAIPITREIGHYSATPHDIDSLHIERELRAQAKRVERLLSGIAKKTNLRWSFKKARGVIHGELLQAAEDTDLIILGKTGWSGKRQLGSTARNVAVRSRIQSLILMRKVRPGTPVMVAYDGSAASKKALAAAQLISSADIPKIILLITEDQEHALELEEEVRVRIGLTGGRVEFRHVPDFDGSRISQLAMISGCDVVVMPVESSTFDAESMVSLLNQADCAVLLVR